MADGPGASSDEMPIPVASAFPALVQCAPQPAQPRAKHVPAQPRAKHAGGRFLKIGTNASTNERPHTIQNNRSRDCGGGDGGGSGGGGGA